MIIPLSFIYEVTSRMAVRFNGCVEDALQMHHFRQNELLGVMLQYLFLPYNQKNQQLAPGC
jgi:hypothetical protein